MINKDLLNKRTLLQIQPKFNARDKFLQIAEEEGLGFEVLELSSPPALNESGFFDTVLDWYKTSKRVMSIHGNFIDVNPASSDILISEISQKRCIDSCRLAEALGAKNVVFHCSCAPFLRGEYLSQWAKNCSNFYNRLLDEYDLNIFIENAFDINPEPLKMLMNNLKSKRFGVCLDVGHANYSKVSLEKWFDDLGEYIKYLHLSNNDGIFDDHSSVYNGTVDWDKANKLWKRLGKNMPITLEFSQIEDIKDALDYFKEKGYFGY